MIDILSDTSLFSLWLMKYGGIVLFIMLAVGIFLLPIPEETSMIIVGVLMHEGKLNIISTALFAYAGAITGITLSYLIGKSAGAYLIERYGRFIGITEARLLKAHYWFWRFGKWVLTIGYFIPGIRHVTGFSAGATDLKYASFALYAYLGAVIWVSIFLSLGYFVGSYSLELLKILSPTYITLIILGIVILVILFFFIRSRLR